MKRWKYFYNLILNNPDYYVDLGVVPYYYHSIISKHEINYLKQLLNTGRVSLFNHGWDHVAPEFDDGKSFDYIDEHLKKWDGFMYTKFQNAYSSVKVLGAPGNTFGQLPNSSIYQALKINNYNALYFSKESGSSNDGRAGLDLEYVNAEYLGSRKLKLRNVDEIIETIRSSDARAVFLQLHPTHRAWNSKLIKNLFDRIYTETDREGINIDDYIVNYFLPDHPNYFLSSQPNSSLISNLKPSILSTVNYENSKMSSIKSSMLSLLRDIKYSLNLKFPPDRTPKSILSFAIMTLIFIFVVAYLANKFYLG